MPGGSWTEPVRVCPSPAASLFAGGSLGTVCGTSAFRHFGPLLFSSRRAMPHTASRIPAWAQPWRRRLLQTLLGGLLAGLVLLVAMLAWLAPQLPSLDPVTTYQPRQPLQVFTADGREIGQFGTERREFVPIERMPPLLVQAVLAVEDQRFYDHGGIDLKGMARAAFSTLTGRMRSGASTITQQVARTFFLSHRFSVERKLKEAVLALEIERRLTKPRILELYMNQIFLGQRAYGFAAAAETYFGKPLDLLSIAEVALLAGLPQNPHYANPVTSLVRAQSRQRVVLQRMQAEGVITAEQADAARAQVLRIGGRPSVPSNAEYVAEMARRTVVERFGPDAHALGLKVYTSVLWDHQQAAWAAVRKGVMGYDARQPWRGPEGREELPAGAPPAELERLALQALKDYRDDETLRAAIVLGANARRLDVMMASGERLALAGDALRLVAGVLGDRTSARDLALAPGAVIRVMQGPERAGWVVTQWPEVEAALVAMDPANGRVRALVGGFDHGKQPFNHVTQAWRQPGSSFKTFLYSAALEQRVMPDTLVNDAPLKDIKGWDPQNSDGIFSGPILVRQALSRSKNLASIRILQQVGLRHTLDWSRRFGFDPSRHPEDLTLALGAGSTTPLELASAYAVLANGGWRVPPVLVERITDAQGKTLFEAPRANLGEADRALPARNVFVTNTMLNDTVRWGTAVRATQALGRTDLYGKTGTTNDAVDAWFAGFHPSMVSVVWLGYDRPRSLGERETGGGLALPVWIQYMAMALQTVPVQPRPAPPQGVRHAGNDWRYTELFDGGMVSRIGVTAAPEEAASEPESAASSPAPAAVAASEPALPARPTEPASAVRP
jgi:penicillin-binding protein 1A